MSPTPVPTVPTGENWSEHRILPQYQWYPDRPDCPDQKQQGLGKNSVSLSALAARWRVDLDHDAAEAEAMAEHYAAPVGPALPDRDPLAEGLLCGFWAHRRGTTA
jgi:hypothetical protein